MTNSGKYAYYGPGLSGCGVRFGSLEACLEAACNGHVVYDLPL
jgi:predicted aconitase